MTPKNERSDLLKLPVVAKRLGMSVGHLRRLIKGKKLAVIRLGARSVRVAPEDLDAFVERRRQAAQV